MAGLDAIEWAGDCHVPPGDVEVAAVARRCCEDAGIQISSYGSYFRGLDREGNPESILSVLDAASALGTSTVRIWAGHWNDSVITPENRRRLTAELQKASQTAAGRGMRLALEFHINTLTNTVDSAIRLISEVNASNLYVYWQPPYWIADIGVHMDGIRKLKKHILNLHVFHWSFDQGCPDFLKAIDRCALEEGANDWSLYLDEMEPHDGTALMEFVRGDDPEQFFADARALKKWLAV